MEENKTIYLSGYTGVTEKIQRTIKDIGNNFCYIGFLLTDCKNNEWYKEGGYENVVEYAEKELGFKKSTTYNFMSVCEKFSIRKNGMVSDRIEDKYNCFTFQKLVQMSSIKNLSLLEEITPDLTVKEIKEKKNSIRVEKEIEGQINILDTDYTEIETDQVETEQVEAGQIELTAKIEYLQKQLIEANEKIMELESNSKLTLFLKERTKLIKKLKSDLIKKEKKEGLKSDIESHDVSLYNGSINELEVLLLHINNK